jgi:hypothetical protein
MACQSWNSTLTRVSEAFWDIVTLGSEVNSRLAAAKLHQFIDNI